MAWWYHDSRGRRVFQHYRVDEPDKPRGKRYGYRYLIGDNDWCYTKPARADSLVYRLPLVLANPDATLAAVEGERDADRGLEAGVLTTCHHGGAGKFTVAQAESLARHRGPFLLVADNDPAGAGDVCRRYDLLRGVGIPAKRLRVREVVPRHPGADLRDHLDAGYAFGDLKPADLDRLREIATTATGHYSEGSWPCVGEPGWVEQWRSNTCRNSGRA
jgi:hypothetical protein